MKHRSAYIICILVLASVIFQSGCVGKSPEESVELTVTDFLNAINEDEPGLAFDLYEGKDFLAPASITMIFNNKDIRAGGIKEINVTSVQISEKLAMVETECIVSSLDLSGKEKNTFSTPVYFKLQNTEVGWIITRVSFTPLEMGEATELNIEVKKTVVDDIADNSGIIFAASVMMLGSGLYLNKKDKDKKKVLERVVDISNATLIANETLAQCIRLVPAQQVMAGKVTTVDVWVKNFARQPYENFAVTAKFGNTMDVENTNLFFDSIAPGETTKKTWIIKPKVAGWVCIEEPIVVFEYMGTKYTGVLDPLWIQVQ
ncbi:hypothetical protein [Methanolobus halotolerans]|uniref:Uncharacterized protein n=1 Tax=Methanolobus halotolerans TaxID=2052935 RepID=A0A4E0PUN0_9EURY|nr:hypothetical protein [Methanolobus halotolerans]TGC08684.1 hypothetical protein CUN85_08385 [Methanolobus halotolerans]